MDKKKTAKQRFDEVVGIIVIGVVVLFLGRYFLSNLESYRELEATVARKIRLPQAVEKVSETLGLQDKGREGLQERIAARKTYQKRPCLEVTAAEPAKTSDEKSTYRVKPLLDKEYYPAVKNIFRSARESIYVAMFELAKGRGANDPVVGLLNELILARRRGIDVKVVVEHPDSPDEELYLKNREAMDYLEAGDVEVHFNDPTRELHDKFILVDQKIAVIGNHNWSHSALTRNKELAIVVYSDPPDPEFIEHFARIELVKPEETEEGRIKLIKEIYRELLQRTAKSKV